MKLKPGLGASYTPSGQETEWVYSTAPGPTRGLQLYTVNLQLTLLLAYDVFPVILQNLRPS